MRFLGRFHILCVVLISAFCFTALPLGVQGGVQGETAEEGSKDSLDRVDVKECAGVEITQCELAKNLILTLKMGEDLTCEACFIQLQALGIAPGDDWSYADPHTVVTPEEMKEVVLEVHEAFNRGTVRLNGFDVAADLNRFCRDIKGPSTAPAPSEQEEKEPETSSPAPSMKPQEHGTPPADTTPPPTEQEGQETETPAADQSLEPPDQGPVPATPSEGTDQQKNPPPADTQETATPAVAGT